MRPMSMNYARILEKCLEIAAESGQIIRSAWDRPRNARHKGAIDLVTETDVETQNFLRKALGMLLPEASFLGEEDDGEARPDPGADLCWIVDPVDGTTNFVHSFPMVACSIGLWKNGQPIFGIVNAPMMGEIFHGGPGLGAFCNGKQIHVSCIDRISDSLVATGFPYDTQTELPDLLRRLAAVLPATQGLRRPGSAALDLCYVACGRLDAYYEHTIKPWDIAGGIAILLEAGGKVSNFSGSPYSFGEPLLGSNGLVHYEMAHLLA